MSKRLTQEEFVARSLLAHNRVYDYSISEYQGRTVEVKINCTDHNTTFWQKAGEHMSGRTSCPTCILEKKNSTRLCSKLALVPQGSKHCKKCDRILLLENFVPNKCGWDNHYSVCRECCAKRSKAFRSDPVIKAKIKEIAAEYTRNNRDKANAKSAVRRANRISRTPKWVDKEWEDFFLKEIYHLATLREEVTGFKWQVDHLVPFQSDFCSGFHCSDNMELIPAFDNLSKGNHYWPNMW